MERTISKTRNGKCFPEEKTATEWCLSSLELRLQSVGSSSPTVEYLAGAKYLSVESSYFRSTAAEGHSGGDGTSEWQSIFSRKWFLLSLPAKVS